MKRFIYLFIGILITITSNAQTITTGAGADYYVNNVLVGEGITVSNVTINTTETNVIGEFSNCSSTNIGLDHGVILACGDVNLALGENDQTNAGAEVGSGSDPDLKDLLGSNYSIEDAVVLEFDFIPLSDHVEFNYVFASEEFPEWAGSNSDYNDVFGFFVSGPGISGPYSNNSMNVALMPGSTSPVTIKNVFETEYYIDNEDGTSIQYDGFTTVFTAAFDVTPCLVYHIKIAIGDAGDEKYDSAIFLKANSFTSNAINVDLTFTDTTSAGSVIEGCGEAILSFTLDEAVASDTTIDYTIGGSATNGTDYTNLNGSITFNAGEDSTSIVISPISDGITEGDETIVLEIQTSVCGTDTFEITILNNTPITADFTVSTPICDYDTAFIQYTGNGTVNDTYTWDFDGGTILSGSGQGPYEIIYPLGSYNVSLHVDAENGCTSDDHQESITINQTPTATFNSTTICEGDVASLIYTGMSGSGATFNWTWPSSCSEATLIGTTTNPDSLTIDFGMGSASNCSPAEITLQVTENGCTSEIETGAVNILPAGTTAGCCQIPEPYAGTDENVCGFITNLNGDAPAPGNNMDWVIINSPSSSNVIFDNVNNWTTQITVDQPGSYTFGYHETSGNCDSTDNVTINFYQIINAFAGDDQEVCGNTMNMTATLTPENNGLWITPPGITVSPNTSPTGVATGTAPSTDTLYWVETDIDNICSDTSMVILNFLEIPSAGADVTDSVCGDVVHLEAINADTLNYDMQWTGPYGTDYEPSDTLGHTNAGILPFSSDTTVSFTFTVTNGSCHDESTHTVNFAYSEFSAFPGNNDQTCNPTYEMQAAGAGYWVTDDSRVSISDLNDHNAIISIDPNTIDYGENCSTDVLLNWYQINGGCEKHKDVTISFFEQPKANAGTDLATCGLEWRLSAIPSINCGVGEWTVFATPDGANATFGDGSQAASESYSTYITASEYGLYTLVWHEKNENNEDCISTDTLKIEFVRSPQVNAGVEDYVCGWRYQMNAIMDQSGESDYGTWESSEAIWTDSTYWTDTPNNDINIIEDPSQQTRPNAYITLMVTEQECKDSVLMIWEEYKNAEYFTNFQCVSKDTVIIHFYADIQAKNNTDVIDGHICGTNINLTNSQVFSCTNGSEVYAYWIDSLNSVTDWNPSSNSPNTQATVGGFITDAFAYVIENGLCTDTSEYVTATFIQNPQVDACPGCDRLEHFVTSMGDYVDSVRTDTVCLTNDSYQLNPYANIGTGYWTYPGSGVTFENGTGTHSDVANDNVSANIFNSSNSASVGDYYTLIWTSSNAGCETKDTLLLSIAKVPSSKIGFRRPYCHGESAKIWAEADLEANPTGFSWQFSDNPTIDSTESGTSTAIDSLMEGSHYVRWTTDGDCDHLSHSVILISTSDWGCNSKASSVIIKEPEIIYPQFNNTDATCGQNNGMIKVINDSITTCEDTLDYTILSCWIKSTLVADPNNPYYDNGVPSFDYQYNYGANCSIDSLFGLSPNDTSWIATSYISLITLDTGYTGPQVTCKDTLALIVDDSGGIDAVIDDERMNTSGTAPLDVTLYHDTPNASKYNWIIRDEEGNIIAEFSDEYPIYTFPEGNYEIDLIVNSKEGCWDTTAYKFIMVDSESFIEIPNVFTPNGDGSNDYFQVYAKSLKSFKGFIMNRWGKVVYEWDDWTTKDKGWDGKILNNYASPGVYFYVIRYQGVYDEDETEVKGTLELVREKE